VIHTQPPYRPGSCACIARGLYSRVLPFESQAERRLHRPRFILVFPNPSNQMGDITSSSLRPLPSKSFPVDHSSIILPLDAVQPGYRQPQRNTQPSQSASKISAGAGKRKLKFLNKMFSKETDELATGYPKYILTETYLNALNTEFLHNFI
jgi:hypothetical protein